MTIDTLRLAAFVLIVAASCGFLWWQWVTRAFEVDDLDALSEDWGDWPTRLS